jgi:probable phosphoglycerate mutase
MITAFCDGACRVSNPGITACAWVLYDSALPTHELSEAKYLGPELRTNNFAEYQGLILLLEFLYTRSIRNVVIYTDSELVVNQTLGKWEVKQPDLKVLATKCYGLLVQGCHVLKHIKGHDGNKGNVRADEICNAVLDLHKEEYELYLYGKN